MPPVHLPVAWIYVVVDKVEKRNSRDSEEGSTNIPVENLEGIAIAYLTKRIRYLPYVDMHISALYCN